MKRTVDSGSVLIRRRASRFSPSASPRLRLLEIVAIVDALGRPIEPHHGLDQGRVRQVTAALRPNATVARNHLFAC